MLCALVFAAAALMAVPSRSPAKDNKLPTEVLDILSKAEQFELLSLNPNSEGDQSKDAFHGYKALGKTVVKNAEARKHLTESLIKGMEGDIDPAKCFNPRHGIRATHDGKTVELVMCFECHQFKVFTGPGHVSGFLVDKSPEPAFDKILKDAGIPKAK
jgi:hypothetical protein